MKPNHISDTCSVIFVPSPFTSTSVLLSFILSYLPLILLLVFALPGHPFENRIAGHVFNITACLLRLSPFPPPKKIILLSNQKYNFPRTRSVSKSSGSFTLACLKDPKHPEKCLHYERKELSSSRLKYHNHLAVIAPRYPKRRSKERAVLFFFLSSC